MRRFVFGFIIGAGLMFGVSAHAEVVNLVGKVIEGQFPVKIDGEQVEAPGIVVDGTSYLPVRTMGELFGYDVSFNADFGVELKKKREAGGERTPIQSKRPNNAPSKESIEQKIKWLEERIAENKRMLEAPNLKLRPEAIEALEQTIPQFEEEIARLQQQLKELEQAP